MKIKISCYLTFYLYRYDYFLCAYTNAVSQIHVDTLVHEDTHTHTDTDIYIYIYIYTQIYIYIYNFGSYKYFQGWILSTIYIYIYIYIYICVCVCVCVNCLIPINFIYMCVYVYVLEYACECVSVYMLCTLVLIRTTMYLDIDNLKNNWSGQGWNEFSMVYCNDKQNMSPVINMESWLATMKKIYEYDIK